MNESNCVIFHDNTEELIYNMDIRYHKTRGTIIGANIADIHMGAINPETEYSILKEQFVDKIAGLPKLDYILLSGDYYDHKIMANSAAAIYGSLLFSDIVNVARQKGSTVILIAGTESHDNGSIKQFYSYLNDPTVDVRIVESIRFEYVKGCKILCIPELYGFDEEIYKKYLFKSGWYDMCFMHGTFDGAVYGNNAGESRLFKMEDFIYCKGPIVSGHVHIPGCFQKYFYYCGSPIRWKFGEEQDKGFNLLCVNLDTMEHYLDFEKIESFTYKTIELDDIIDEDPKVVIDYITNLKEKEGVDYLKIKFNTAVSNSNKIIINNYFKPKSDYTLVFQTTEEEHIRLAEQKAQIEQYNYILDQSLTDEAKFVMYVNDNEGYEFITVERLKDILTEI